MFQNDTLTIFIGFRGKSLTGGICSSGIFAIKLCLTVFIKNSHGKIRASADNFT